MKKTIRYFMEFEEKFSSERGEQKNTSKAHIIQ